MRRWTVVAGLYATLFAPIALLGLASLSCTPNPAPTADAVALTAAAALDTLRLMVGDTIDLTLRPGSPPAVVTRAVGPVNVDARFSADAQPYFTVDSLGRVVGDSAGTDFVTAIPTAPPRMSVRVAIQVVTPEEAANLVAAEICPNEDGRAILRSRPLAGSVPAIHEFHDCQRLIERGAYSAVVGIFASGHAREWRRWEDYEGGRLAATIINFVHKGRLVPYQALNIPSGTNCLVLKADGPGRWHAAIMPQADSVVTRDGGRHYAPCDDGLTWNDVPDSLKGRLEVHRQTGVDMKGRRISPPVARWDWDPVNLVNYIGVSCDAQTWCEIGPPGFTRSAPFVRTASDRRERADTILKGYYDEQFLADSTGTVPTSVFGRIVPGAHAGDATDMSYGVRRWYHVAEIALEETAQTPSTDYARYVRYFAGSSASGGALARRTSSSYELRPDHSSTKGRRGVYEGRFNGQALPADSIVYRWHSHLKGMPPTVRWRWVESDERTWTYCDPEGCCENQAGLKS